jgi:hypothetical protein
MVKIRMNAQDCSKNALRKSNRGLCRARHKRDSGESVGLHSDSRDTVWWNLQLKDAASRMLNIRQSIKGTASNSKRGFLTIYGNAQHTRINRDTALNLDHGKPQFSARRLETATPVRHRFVESTVSIMPNHVKAF